MANIQAICSECGAHLTIDHEGARCPYCGTPIAMGHSGGYELSIRATMAEDGEAFMEMEDWASAQNSYSRLIRFYPYDYRGFWGMAQVFSRNFTFTTPNKSVYETICDYANKAYKVADPGSKQVIVSAMRDYQSRLEDVNAIGAVLETAFSAPQTEAPKISLERRKIERKVQDLSEQIEKMRTLPRRLAIIFGLSSFGVLAASVLVMFFTGAKGASDLFLIAVLFLLAVYAVAFLAYWVGRAISQKQISTLKKQRKRLVKTMESTK